MRQDELWEGWEQGSLNFSLKQFLLPLDRNMIDEHQGLGCCCFLTQWWPDFEVPSPKRLSRNYIYRPSSAKLRNFCFQEAFHDCPWWVFKQRILGLSSSAYRGFWPLYGGGLMVIVLAHCVSSAVVIIVVTVSWFYSCCHFTMPQSLPSRAAISPRGTDLYNCSTLWRQGNIVFGVREEVLDTTRLVTGSLSNLGNLQKPQ